MQVSILEVAKLERRHSEEHVARHGPEQGYISSHRFNGVVCSAGIRVPGEDGSSDGQDYDAQLIDSHLPTRPMAMALEWTQVQVPNACP